MKLIKNLFHKLKTDNLFVKSIKVLFIRVSGVALSFASLLLLTNYFSEETVGKYNYLNSVLIVLGALCLLGMNSSFLQFSGKLEAENKFSEIVNVYYKKITILVISCSTLYMIYFAVRYFLQELLIATGTLQVLDRAILGVFFYSICLLNFEVIRGLRKLIVSEFYRNIFRFGALLLVVIVLIYIDEEPLFLDLFIFTLVVMAVVTTIHSINLLNKLKSITAAQTNDQSIGYRQIISVSIPMTISFLALLIMQSIDVIMLKYYFEYNIVAYYGIVMRVSFLIGVVLTSINAIISPSISKLFYSNKKRELTLLMNKAIKLNFILTLPFILLLVVFPKEILGLFGSNYQASSMVLIIILLGQIINVFSGSVGVYLNMTGRQKIFQKILLLTLVINILLNFTLIPKNEMVGAAISTSISLILWNLIGVIYIYKKDKILLFINRKVFIHE